MSYIWGNLDYAVWSGFAIFKIHETILTLTEIVFHWKPKPIYYFAVTAVVMNIIVGVVTISVNACAIGGVDDCTNGYRALTSLVCILYIQTFMFLFYKYVCTDLEST